MRKTRFILSTICISLLSIIYFGCVDSIIDNKAGTPSITIYSPASNDTVKIGQNLINYEASDHANGTGLSSYEVYLNGGLVNTIGQNTDGTNPVLYLIVPETLLGQKINYSVKVYNQSGQSTQSNNFENIFVIDNIPDRPANLVLTRLNDHSVNLLWDDSSDNETSFELWRKVSSSGYYGTNPYKILPANSISTDDVGLSPTIEYFYKVRAVNGTGSSAFSNEVSTSGSSTNLWDLKAYAIGSSAVHLKWIDFFPNELGFILERINPISGNWERVQPLPLRNTTEYFDYNVSANTTYQYRITYYTNTTIGPWSNTVIITTYYTDDVPPKDLVAINISGGNVRVSWTDNSDLEDGTVIERKKGDNGTYVVAGQVGEDVTVFNETLNESAKYYYRARHILTDKVYTYFSNEASVVIQ